MEDDGGARTCMLCGVQVGAANLQLHSLRCPGPASRGRSISEGSWADGSGSRAGSEEGEVDEDEAEDEDEDVRLAIALSLAAVANPEEDDPTAWSCSACTVRPLLRPPSVVHARLKLIESLTVSAATAPEQARRRRVCSVRLAAPGSRRRRGGR